MGIAPYKGNGVWRGNWVYTNRIGGFVGEILDGLQAGVLGAQVLAAGCAARSAQGVVRKLRGGGVGEVVRTLRQVD